MRQLHSLENTVSRIINECPESAVSRLLEIIENKSITSTISVYQLSIHLGNDYIPPLLLSDLVETWKNYELPSDSLALAFRTAINTRNQILEQVPLVDMVWTGPYPPAAGNIRTTLAVMQEMIETAKSKIFVVGYSLTTAGTFQMAVLEKLIGAVKRGCEVRIALHDGGNNYTNLRRAWPDSLLFPILLKWSGRPGDHMASLHAKLLLVDQQDLLVTSANFTYHGLFSNIEVGVRVRGKVASQISRHFVSLETSGILQRVED